MNRYELRFDKMFFYSCQFKDNDRKVIIDKLKAKCLEAVRNNLNYLSELPDEKLLEILEVQEFKDE